jgi:hypothetical protein
MHSYSATYGMVRMIIAFGLNTMGGTSGRVSLRPVTPPEMNSERGAGMSNVFLNRLLSIFFSAYQIRRHWFTVAGRAVFALAWSIAVR